MKKIFEDEFAELQGEFISLCLEVTERKVDKIYAYCSIEKVSTMFNAFFEVNGNIKTLGQLNIEESLIWEFLKTGTYDLKKVEMLCNKYNMPVPTQIKMYYDVNTGKFEADYKYDEICCIETGLSGATVFQSWVEEVKASKQ